VVVAVRAVAADPRSRPRAIILSRDPWFDMLLAPARGIAIAAGPRPAVIAYVHGDRQPSTDRRDQLAQLFGLTPSEAKLALALSRGMTIAEAAADFGLTVETARNYSKKIYSKTGARGQPDLIRFVMRSVLAIA
jgi:DNA-binding CsgD family transcriptional regulator